MQVITFSVDYRCPACDSVQIHRFTPGLRATHYDPPEPAQVECQGCGEVDLVDVRELLDEHKYQRRSV